MLQDVRERKGMSKVELSKLSGVSVATIISIEKGYKPKRETFGKLANALKVEIEEIM